MRSPVSAATVRDLVLAEAHDESTGLVTADEAWTWSEHTADHLSPSGT